MNDVEQLMDELKTKLNKVDLILDSLTQGGQGSDDMALFQSMGAIIGEALEGRSRMDVLVEREALIHAILDNAVDAIITADKNGVIRSVNRAAEEMFGYGPAELIGQNVSVLAPEEIARHHDHYLRNYQETGRNKIIGTGREAEARRKDGSLFPVDLSVSEVPLPGRRMFTAIIRDITERRKYQAQLTERAEALLQKQGLIDEDLKAAAAIQHSLLPTSLPESDTLGVAFEFAPSAYVGGDILGVLPLDPDNRRVAFYVLDVAGHGVPSAMVAVAASQVLHPLTGFLLDEDKPRSPSELLAMVDKTFPLERFEKHFTMFYGIIDTRSGELQYSHAAHPLALLIRKNGEVTALTNGGTIIGLGGIIPFDPGHETLKPGDKLLVYTDGVLELTDTRDEFYGEARLIDLVRRSRRQPIAEFLRTILKELRHFSGGKAFNDDVTLLGFEFKAPPFR